MNNINKILFYMVAITFLFAACTPDENELGAVDVTPEMLAEGPAFSITKDASNPNIIYLESKMDAKYASIWIHPHAYSRSQKVTLKIPFEGTYQVTFSVMTRGGVVYGEPAEFVVNSFYAPFVEDELWTLLSGGVNNEKTWYLDLDADGVSRYFEGPQYFYGLDDWWGNVSGNEPPLGGNSWNWCPDWKGNQWLMDAANYGSMTFNLKGGANVTVEHLTKPSLGTEVGLYMLNTETKELRLTNASILSQYNADYVFGGFRECRIMSLTANTLPPGPTEEPEPSLPYGWQDDVSQIVTTTTTVKWILSPDNPFDWANLDGSLMNNWDTPADWTGWDESVPATYANFSLLTYSAIK